jgi:hypothetical protein
LLKYRLQEEKNLSFEVALGWYWHTPVQWDAIGVFLAVAVILRNAENSLPILDLSMGFCG